MLVIRRRPGESVHIGDEIEISVVEAGPNRVKLGIRAPREIPVLRGEIHLTREENLRAAEAAGAEGFRERLGKIGPLGKARP